MRNNRGIAPVNIVLSIVAAGIVALFVYNIANRPPNQHIGDSKPWVQHMSRGNANTKNVFIDYTDYFCSYCAQVEAATSQHEFNDTYIRPGKLRYEHRVITVLKSMVPNSEQGAEAAYCAADQNKYWEYTHDIVPRIKSDYFDKGIGVKNVAVPKEIPKLPLNYFAESAKSAKLDVAAFSDCMTHEKHKSEIEANTKRALALGVSGLPYIVVNNYTTSGFAGGYNGLQTILKAGGVNP